MNLMSVGLEFKENINGLNYTFTDFKKEETLLDGDIILFSPLSLAEQWRTIDTDNEGYKTIYANSPFAVRLLSQIRRKRDELEILSQKKTIVVTLLDDLSYIRVRKSEYDNKFVSNLSFLPFGIELIESSFNHGKGSKVIKSSKSSIFDNFYKAYSNDLTYFCYFNEEMFTGEYVSAFSNSVNKTVGFIRQYYNSLYAFLPVPNDLKEPKKFLGSLIEAFKLYTNNLETSTPPSWLDNFILPSENSIENELDSIRSEIDILRSKEQEIMRDLNNVTKFKELLYEQGAPLELIVEDAFKLIGFQTEKRKESDIEHDIIISAPEGRAIVEVEGKDNAAININKLDQLSRVIDEDFTISNLYPDGILVGNHYRKTDPPERKDAFTDKVKISANRKNIILLNTFEIYKVIEYVLKEGKDEISKANIRREILNSKGAEFLFKKLNGLP